MSLRVAFLANRRFEFQVPQRTPWAESAWFPVVDDWGPEIASASKFQPDVTFVFEPLSRGGRRVNQIPGIKVGIVTQQPSQAELAEAVRRHRTGAGTLHWFTWFEEPPPAAKDLPLLGLVAATLDAQRLPFPPSLDRADVAIPAWAKPAGLPVSAKLLPANDDRRNLEEALSPFGILLYHSEAPLRLNDPVLLFALGHGQLLISNQPFPAECGLEQEDEYLVRPVKEWARIVEKEREGLGSLRAVRVRAFQKVRELFDASLVFRRLAHDALLLRNGGRTSPTRWPW